MLTKITTNGKASFDGLTVVSFCAGDEVELSPAQAERLLKAGIIKSEPKTKKETKPAPKKKKESKPLPLGNKLEK